MTGPQRLNGYLSTVEDDVNEGVTNNLESLEVQEKQTIILSPSSINNMVPQDKKRSFFFD
jgi:hypothetical protein